MNVVPVSRAAKADGPAQTRRPGPDMSESPDARSLVSASSQLNLADADPVSPFVFLSRKKEASCAHACEEDGLWYRGSGVLVLTSVSQTVCDRRCFYADCQSRDGFRALRAAFRDNRDCLDGTGFALVLV